MTCGPRGDFIGRFGSGLNQRSHVREMYVLMVVLTANDECQCSDYLPHVCVSN